MTGPYARGEVAFLGLPLVSYESGSLRFVLHSLGFSALERKETNQTLAPAPSLQCPSEQLLQPGDLFGASALFLPFTPGRCTAQVGHFQPCTRSMVH